MEGGGCGYDGGEFGVVAVVEDLAQFLLCPWGGAVASQSVEDEDGDGPYLLE